MRFQKLTLPVALLLSALVLFNFKSSDGQVLEPIQTSKQGQSGTSSQEPEDAKPFVLSSRFHLQKGTSTGYLIVKVEIPKGSYIYSLTQTAPLRPTKIRVTESNQFRLKGEFTPDQPAIVIEEDPVFKQRLEKHKNVVQFFVPVEIAEGTDVQALSAEMFLSGQVCTDQGFCIPISDVKTNGRFAGYFERSAKKRTNSPINSSTGNPQR